VLAEHQDWLVVTLEVVELFELVVPLVLDPVELDEESSSEDVVLVDVSSEDATVVVPLVVCCAALLADVLPR
jgi:hypothetical protein